MAVIERQADQVKPQRADETRILIRKKVFEIPFEEEFSFLFSQSAAHNLPKGILICRKTGDEVFHIHPTTQADTVESNLLTSLVLDVILVHL
jgi:hypothetical protein